jgi:LysM repeat protein
MEFAMSRSILVIRIWLVLMVMIVSLTGTSVFAQGGTVVRVDPSAVSAQVNDSVNLSIKVDNIVNLTAIELHLSFNPSVLEVVTLTNGGFVAADFSAQNTFDNAAGTIDYAVAQMNRTPAQGSGALLNIAFRAKANGNSPISLRATQAVPNGLLLSDPNGMAIGASWIGGSVVVGTPASSTPTPITPASSTPTPITPASVTHTPVTPASSTPTSVPLASITPTPITFASATPTPTPSPSGSILGTHIVRWGEYLYCIGRAYGVSPWSIAQANGVWWPYIIFPNQKLLIPNILWTPIPSGPVCKSQFVSPKPTSPPPATPTAITATGIPTTPIATTSAVPPLNCRAVYIVLPGDTLYHIATLYGTSYAEIARVNQISNPRLIYSGQQLCIP